MWEDMRKIRSILITAGGTSEPIDSVRSIANKGTGKLGSLIADCLVERCRAENYMIERSSAERSSAESDLAKPRTNSLNFIQTDIYYVHAKGAILPKAAERSAERSENVRIKTVQVETVSQLFEAVENILEQAAPDAIIHSMAVSDYKTKAFVSLSDLFKAAKTAGSEKEFIEKTVSRNLARPGAKISSQNENPAILLEKTPKMLPMFRQRCPEAVIVGFKLLSGKTDEELIEVGRTLLEKAGCDYVFTNDYAHIADGNHKGYLIGKESNIEQIEGKENIAQKIAQIAAAAHIAAENRKGRRP